MNCKHCNISMTLVETSNRFLCETCQHSEPAIPVAPPSSNTVIEPLGKSASFHCLSCDQQQLLVGRIHKTEVFYCGICRGFVIDRPALGDLVEYLRSRYEGSDSTPVAFDPQQLQIRLDCLACLTPMETLSFSGPGNVVISTCETCKISWVEDGDLDRIVRAPGRRSYEFKLPEYTMRRRGGLIKAMTISYHN